MFGLFAQLLGRAAEHFFDWWPLYGTLGLLIVFGIAYSASVDDFRQRCRSLQGIPVVTSHNGWQCFAKDNTQIDWEK